MRKIKLKTAGITICAVCLIAIIVHILTIFNVIPFEWLNGGQINSQEVARVISIAGIVFLSINIFINLAAAKMIPVKFSMPLIVMLKIYLWIQTVFMGLSIPAQLMGTPFEKVCMTILVLVGFLSSLRLALEKRSNYLN